MYLTVQWKVVAHIIISVLLTGFHQLMIIGSCHHTLILQENSYICLKMYCFNLDILSIEYSKVTDQNEANHRFL
jgi:hypothetical protein